MTDDFLTEGSRNVYADLGVPNAGEHLLKAQLVHRITRILDMRGLTERQAAQLLGMKQSEVASLLRGRFRLVAVDTLLRCLVALGQDVEIVIRPHADASSSAQLTLI